MSYRIDQSSSYQTLSKDQASGAASRSESGGSDSSFDEADDQDWADWVDDEGNAEGQATRALFADTSRVLPTPKAALDDARAKGCDFEQVVKRCQLDALQVIRLVNYIRKATPEPSSIAALQGDESFLNDDENLMPVVPDDPLLQIDFDTDDSAAATQSGSNGLSSNKTQERSRIVELEAELRAVQQEFNKLRANFAARLGISGDGVQEATVQQTVSDDQHGARGKAPVRDDDTHYFQSYAGHDIHQTMIADRVRTLSYAKFLLSPANAHLIRGKTVMDVGCGSGILSLLAARAGAARVLAVDASDVADRARANVESNGFGHVVRVFKGKVEELADQLAPWKGKVDLLVSEWMGYFLLYESMLPSVLHARDLYLAPGGLLAPSHSRMTLAAVSDSELLHQRIGFWNDVHGFTMPSMTRGLVDETYTEYLDKSTVVSDVADIFDMPLQTMVARQPSFVSPFSLTASKRTTVHGFLSWFDTWFMPSKEPVPTNGRPELKGGERLEGLPPVTVIPPVDADVPALALKRDQVVEEQDVPESQRGEVVSFTTGPEGLETHWKQTVFLLKEPLEVEQGTLITGEIHVTASDTNSRELDVEVHYSVRAPGSGADRQKGDKVEARIVQLYHVR